MSRVLEIRSYTLKPGTQAAFHQLVEEQAILMLLRWKVDVVDYGPSIQEGDTYYLMRSYESVADLQQSQDAFYGSAEWKTGPREPILALIENYVSVVISVDDTTLTGLRSRQIKLA